MINRAVLVGRITKDPELKKTGSGLSVVSFTLACNRRFSSSDQQEADFINCIAWRQSADFMANYVKKGSLLGVDGRIQTRNYKDQNDRTIYVTEVVCDSVQILESKRESTSASHENNSSNNLYSQNQNQQDSVSSWGNTIDIEADDLPF